MEASWNKLFYKNYYWLCDLIKLADGVVDTGGKFAAGINDTSGIGGKFAAGVVCTLTCKYLCEFAKKFEMTLMLLSEAWGKMINEKNQKQKIS